MDIVDRRVSVFGLDIHYLQSGTSGAPVVLLHGGGTDSARLSWGEMLGPLADCGFRVYAPDLPGYGLSARPNASYTNEYYVTFVSGFLDALALTHTSLGGLSMGGAIALGFALRYPSAIDRLVLVDSYGLQGRVAHHKLSYLTVHTPGVMEGTWALVRRSRGMTRSLAGGIFHDMKAVPSSLIDLLFAEARQRHAGRAFTTYQRDELKWGGLKTVYMDRLGEIQAPTLIIHGREDKAVPLAWAEEAHKRIAGSKLVIIDGAGHWPQREKPAEVQKALVDFFGKA